MNKIEDTKLKCHLCFEVDSELLLKVEGKPKGETDYGILENNYYREIRHCNNCGVFFNHRDDGLIPEDFYEGRYNEAIEMGSLEKRFNKIITFTFEKSDNKNRVLRIVNFLYRQDMPIRGMKVLDVGAGTCVFLHEIKKFGFETFSVDPDMKSKIHSEKTVKVTKAFCGTLESMDPNFKFDLITFNKVLEHVKNPISILKKAKEMLKQGGLIYVELPDGENLAKKNHMLDRSEFYIDHHTTFNKASYEYLIINAGLKNLLVDQILDPSGKMTIFGMNRLI